MTADIRRHQFSDPAEFVEFDCRGCRSGHKPFGVFVCINPANAKKKPTGERRCQHYSRSSNSEA